MTHVVSIRANNRTIDRWEGYEITNDMLSPADNFSLTLRPGIRAVYDLVPLDSEIEVRIDEVPVLSAFIEDRESSAEKSSGQILTISGRDRTSRMLDESADLGVFGKGLDLLSLGNTLARPTFPDGATISNADNRNLVRGRRSGKADANTEPIFTKRSAAPKKVEPGETRWDVLQQFLEPANLLAWAQADGKKLVIGLPNYDQGTQYKFFAAKAGSGRSRETNIKSYSVRESNANRFSTITVVGSSKGDSSNYGKNVTKHTASLRKGATEDGTGGNSDFLTRKQLIIQDDDIKNATDALNRASREFEVRDSERLIIDLVVNGHSQQRRRNDIAALFAFDTLADVEIEELGITGIFLITKVVFRRTKADGETTAITLVPQFTVLTS